MKIAFIGTYPPRQCGIATFTQDLFKAISASGIGEYGVIAVSDGTEENFPDEVVLVIDKTDLNSYIKAAHLLNTCYDACIVQHEFGIFGGIRGSYILHLLQELHIPVVSNLHTVLPQPDSQAYRILRQIGRSSSKVTVMTDRAVQLLKSAYDIPAEKVELIPHGTPLFDYDQDRAKAELGLSGKKVMLSFGLLGPGKGFETAIESLTHIRNDGFIYIILGQTHPNILRDEGEKYRESLVQHARKLGVENNIRFINVFATEALLVQYLTACDLFVTPYPNQDQICSGTLTFAVGAGAAVISTPYLYARDLLAEERGLLFGIGDVLGLATIVTGLLADDGRLAGYRARARAYGEDLAWPRVGRKHLRLLQNLQTVQPSISIQTKSS